jgi:hypothetical protein
MPVVIVMVVMVIIMPGTNMTALSDHFKMCEIHSMRKSVACHPPSVNAIADFDPRFVRIAESECAGCTVRAAIIKHHKA